MLKVPPTILNIYTLTGNNNYDGDTRHKGIRIHFPNGEMNDITNDNIVSETFSFTESVCSADSFKFGLCEGTEVSFETVGIGNITGYTIEVWYEIDVHDIPSISGCYTESADLLTVEDGYTYYMPDKSSTYGQSCDFRGVYAIPFGKKFVVQSSPRSKSDMTHRDVQALTKVFETNSDLTPFETWRIVQMHKKKYFSMDIPEYIDCQIGNTKDYVMTAYALSDGDKTTINPFSNYNPKKAPYKWVSEGDATTVNFYDTGTVHLGMRCTSYNKSTLKTKSKFKCTGLARQYDIYNIIPKYPSFSNFETFIKNKLKENPLLVDFVDWWMSPSNPDYRRSDFYEFYYYVVTSFGVRYSKSSTKVGVFGVFSALDNKLVYPYDNGVANSITKSKINYGGRIYIPTDFEIEYYNVDLVTPNNDHKIIISLSEMLDIEYGDNSTTYASIDKFALRFKHTLKTSAKTYKYSFYNAFSVHDLIAGYFEIMAKFGHTNRNGDYEEVRLKPNADKVIGTSDYESLFYEEYVIDKIGTVTYKYVDKNDTEQEENLSIGSGTSIYDMTDNGIFSAIDADEAISDKILKKKIENFLTKMFEPRISLLETYVPVELTFHAKPFLEAGDRYDIITPSGNTISTYNMSMTFNGIQDLKAEMTSTTGQIIDAAYIAFEEEDDDDDAT